MAGVTSVHSDSEDSNKAGVSKSKSKLNPVKGDPESENEEGSEEGGEEEYEIEEVLDAKRGYFPDGRMGYLVKWKGYGPADNSWVDESDAVNAQDLVNEFWKKNPHKKKAGSTAGRKSVDKKSPKKGRKSAATDDTPDAEDTSTKKRGRKSSASQRVESEDEMAVDEPAEKPAKKARKNSTQPTKANAKKQKTASPEVDEKPLGNMKAYMHLQEWEGLVKTVDTVEQQHQTGKLVVFFTLQTGERVREFSEVCKDRFPRKLIEFYESNLKWRQAGEDESS